MPRPLDPDKRAAILDDIKAGHARNVIAREHGVSAGTVTNIARAAGLTHAFDRSATKRATEAAQADAASERATLAAESLAAARAALRRALAALPEASARDAAVSYGILVDKHRALVDMDRDPEGLAAVDAWLRGITGQ
ncbi:hypothetical protein [Microbispora sp. CA-102843]|uniref:hypothetical protein n=1 Tax=Microbispora sp. CA-102843 TaxID=3239952 RepID=UPI003D8B546F